MKSTLSESIGVKQDREKVPSGRTLVSAIKRSTTDALTIISDVIKVKAIQCFPTGDFFSYFKGIRRRVLDANEPQSQIDEYNHLCS